VNIAQDHTIQARDDFSMKTIAVLEGILDFRPDILLSLQKEIDI
jgi:hypothetical protein